MPDWDALDQLRAEWTDKNVRVASKLPRYARFEGKSRR